MLFGRRFPRGAFTKETAQITQYFIDLPEGKKIWIVMDQGVYILHNLQQGSGLASFLMVRLKSTCDSVSN